MIEQRSGIFFVKRIDILQDQTFVEYIMRECIVIEATNHFYNETIEYIAYSDQFDVVPMGERCPNYEWGMVSGRAVAKKIEEK